MADSYEPTEFAATPVKRRYPWATWETEPFKVWTLYRDIDFDVDPFLMGQVLYTRAARNNAKGKPAAEVSVQKYETSVEFCFYRSGQDRPILGRRKQMEGSRAITEATAAALDIPTIICDQCGNVQARVEHLLHITTCLTNTPKGLTADHFDNQIVTIMSTYTKEDGFS